MDKLFHLTAQDASKILESLNTNDLDREDLTKDSIISIPGVCCVFDLSGSSASIKENGSRAFLDKNKNLFSDMTQIIYSRGGIIEKFPGDGISFHFLESQFETKSLTIISAISAIVDMDSYLRSKYDLNRSQYRFTVAYGDDTVMTFLGNDLHLELITVGHGVNVAHRLEKKVKEKMCFLGVDYKCFSTAAKVFKGYWNDIDVEYYYLPADLIDTSRKPFSKNLWFGFKY